jgi:hypothetical protein
MKWVMWYNKNKPQQLEEDNITLMTMRPIKAVCSKTTNERKFVIQCVMDEYEESNATI